MDLEIVKAFQSLESSFLTAVAALFYYLAHPIVLTCLAAVIYYVVDKKLAFRYLACYSVAFLVNGSIKELVKRQRPYTHEGVKSLEKDPTSSYSFPSGHAMGAAAYLPFAVHYGYRGKGEKKRIWVFAIVAFIIIMIGLSRVYMGAHYLSDIAAGWAIGLAVAFGIEYAVHKLKDRVYFFAMLAVPVFLLILILIPEMDGSATGIGFLAAISVGFYIDNKFIKYEQSKNIWFRLLQAFIAINGAMLIFFVSSVVLAKVFDAESVDKITGAAQKIFSYAILFFLANLWIYLACPAIFKSVRKAIAGKRA